MFTEQTHCKNVIKFITKTKVSEETEIDKDRTAPSERLGCDKELNNGDDEGGSEELFLTFRSQTTGNTYKIIFEEGRRLDDYMRALKKAEHLRGLDKTTYNYGAAIYYMGVITGKTPITKHIFKTLTQPLTFKVLAQKSNTNIRSKQLGLK
ncbi:MAG: hypothetical protein V4482_05430 [Pseudomonadota bacterium]